MNAASLLVELQNPDDCQAPTADEFLLWVRAALGTSRAGEVAVRVVAEAESAALNLQYRGREGATNVLSFPADETLTDPGDEPLPIGDLVICAPVVEREAAEQGKTLRAHWAHMTVHGALHLVGYDHETDAEAAVMEDREREILAGLGMEDPYL